MQRTTFSVVVVRADDGRAEIISRPGHLDPHAFARAGEANGGKAIAVRHEMVEPNGRNRRTVSIFPMK